MFEYQVSAGEDFALYCEYVYEYDVNKTYYSYPAFLKEKFPTGRIITTSTTRLKSIQFDTECDMIAFLLTYK